MDSRSKRQALLIPIGLALVIGSVAGGALLIGGAQASARRQLEARLELRVALSSQFIASYVTNVMDREAAVAKVDLSAADGRAVPFASVVKAFGFAAAVLLDSEGRLLQVAPEKPGLVGTLIAPKYRHLAEAVAGRRAVSNVVASAASGIAIVAFAVPFDTPYGRRVLSGAYDLSSTPLSAYLSNLLPFAGSGAVLVDSTGAIVSASNTTGAGPGESAAVVASSAAAQVGGIHSAIDPVTGATLATTSSAVSGTPFSVVAWVPTAELLAPLSGGAQWIPWLTLAAFGVSSLYALGLLAALARSRRDLAVLARIDGLTGLENRRSAEEHLAVAVAESKRSGEPVSVLLVDVDQFKRLNDDHGHAAGDQALREISDRMRRALRPADVLGRWGGEEFLAILPRTTLADARAVGERLRQAVRGLPLGTGALYVTISAGCAEAVGGTIDELVSSADKALYLAKNTRDRVEASPAGGPASGLSELGLSHAHTVSS